MRAKGFALLGLLPYIVGGIAVAGFSGWVWWKAQHWCNTACGEQTERAQAAEQKLVAAQERATALALLWAEAIHKVEKVYVEKVVERAAKFTSIRERVGTINVAGGIKLDSAAIGVLSDAAATANNPGVASGSEGTTAPLPEPARDTSADEWVRFAVDAAEAYADAREKWMACVSWADAIKQSDTRQ